MKACIWKSTVPPAACLQGFSFEDHSLRSCWSSGPFMIPENACPHAAVGTPIPDSASPDMAMPWEILPHPATMQPFTRKAAFLALIENKLWICSKARLSDDATDEEEVAEKDDVAEALDWDKVVEPNIAAVASAFDSVALFY